MGLSRGTIHCKKHCLRHKSFSVKRAWSSVRSNARLTQCRHDRSRDSESPGLPPISDASYSMISVSQQACAPVFSDIDHLIQLIYSFTNTQLRHLLSPGPITSQRTSKYCLSLFASVHIIQRLFGEQTYPCQVFAERIRSSATGLGLGALPFDQIHG